MGQQLRGALLGWLFSAPCDVSCGHSSVFGQLVCLLGYLVPVVLINRSGVSSLWRQLGLFTMWRNFQRVTEVDVGLLSMAKASKSYVTFTTSYYLNNSWEQPRVKDEEIGY